MKTNILLLALSLGTATVHLNAQDATPPPQGSFTLAQTISDGAQRTTLAFDGLAIMTGNLDAQSFFPPGKVADYTGFQYLRDNDPNNMGHNTSFLTRVANNILYILSDSQLAQLVTLATNQMNEVSLYGYKRFPLMMAFRRLVDGNVPTGSTGLNLTAVKQASRELYLIDGQISFDRALLYASIYQSMTSYQLAYLEAMKGLGWSSWPDITNDQIQSKMQSLPPGSAVAVMTYASDLFSWYAGSLEADVYFCPERQGTYYGGFYIKDAPAVGHEGYSISEQLTATAGAALCDSSKGYVTANQAAVISSLVDLQRTNLYAGVTNIVSVRTQIATLLRSLLVSTASSNSIKSQVLALSGIYGDLDGENNYHYATIFAQVYQTLTSLQKTNLMALRKSIMSGTYADGTPFDFSTCTTPFLYSDIISNTNLLAPYITNTDYLFATNAGSTMLTKPSITAQPVSQLLAQGQTLALSVGASGSSPLSYQWYGNNVKILAANNRTATNSTFIMTNITVYNQGNYYVVVKNLAGMVISRVAMVTVKLAPKITAQPANQTVALGSIKTLTVAVSGTGPFSYYWIKNAFSTQTTATGTLVVTNTATASYQVIVSNAVGCATSQVFTLTTMLPPRITVQPTNTIVTVGQPLTLNASADGSTPLTYQWYFNNVKILAANNNTATNSTFIKTNVTTNSSGKYFVVVKNPVGMVTSKVAVVSVNLAVKN